MSFNYSPNTVTDGLIVYIDAANTRSYPGTGNAVKSLTGKERGLTFSLLEQTSWTASNIGSFQFPTPVGTATASRIQGGAGLDWNATEITIDVWINRASSNNDTNTIWSVYYPFCAFRNNNKFYLTWPVPTNGGLAAPELETTKTFSNNTWYNVCCTISNKPIVGVSTAKIYVNGVLEAETTFSPVLGVYTTPSHQQNGINIGNSSNIPRTPFVGRISNFKMYNRVLTPEEVLRNYHALESRY